MGQKGREESKRQDTEGGIKCEKFKWKTKKNQRSDKGKSKKASRRGGLRGGLMKAKHRWKIRQKEV